MLKHLFLNVALEQYGHDQETMTQLLEKGKAEDIDAELTKAMLAEGEPVSKIAKWTGLSEAEMQHDSNLQM